MTANTLGAICTIPALIGLAIYCFFVPSAWIAFPVVLGLVAVLVTGGALFERLKSIEARLERLEREK